MDILSAVFLIFLAVSLLIYYLCPQKWQPPVLLIANLVFYLWRSPVFGVFLAAAILIAYFCAIMMSRQKCRKLFLLIPMVWCFGALFLFKYLDHFLENFLHVGGPGLDAILPIGISFYSFSLVGYIFDVYREKISPEKNLIYFAAYASFFPSILSGPINRARDLLPQIREKHVFNGEVFKRGLLRFTTGAAKKLIAAALLGSVADKVWSSPRSYSGGMWLITVFLYSLQIYVDFSSYSDMAIGTADMLGIRLEENFSAPYLSCSVKSFWKKWHISLTSWFREYLYFPLGGSRKGKWRTRLNVLTVFAVSGIWHAAGLPFLIWGILNGLLQIIEDMALPARKKLTEKLSGSKIRPAVMLLRGAVTFCLITLTWIFFRSGSLGEAVFIIQRILLILRDGVGVIPRLLSLREIAVLAVSLLGILAEDICIAKGCRPHPEKKSLSYWMIMALLYFAVLLFGHYGPGFNAGEFVYFKF